MTRAIILAILCGYSFAWATEHLNDSVYLPTADFAKPKQEHLEYLLRDGRRAYKHSDLGFVVKYPDAKVWKAALHISCQAISGGLPCR